MDGHLQFTPDMDSLWVTLAKGLEKHDTIDKMGFAIFSSGNKRAYLASPEFRSASIAFDSATKCLIKHRCTNTSIVVNVLRFGFKITCPDLAHYPLLDDSKKWEKYLTTPYRKSYSLSSELLTDPVLLLASYGKVEILEVFLNFGMTTLQSKCDNMERVELECLWFAHIFKKMFGASFPRNGVNILMSEFSSHLRRRFFLILKMAEMFFNMRLPNEFGENNADRYRACLRLYFNSIPEPLISGMEIRSLSEKLLPCDASDQAIMELASLFEIYFPKALQPVAPRTLKHLCRCQVRETLRAAKCMPHGTESLDIHKTLRDYILLK